MMISDPRLLEALGLCTVLLLIAGLYCIMVSTNLIRILIGVELIAKALTLLLVAAGHLSGRGGLGEALAITLIVVEVVVIAVAAGVVVGAYRYAQSLSARHLESLKG